MNKTICQVEGCEKEPHSRGFCASHYTQKKNSGELKVLRRRKFWSSTREKFDASYIPLDYTGCWLWTESCFESGYAQIGEPKGGKNRKASRVSWELFRGPIPEGMSILHKCDNRWCVNPDHLFLGTHLENMADMTSKKRQARGVTHGMVKIDEKSALEIRNSNESYSALAIRFGVTKQNVYRIKKNQIWRQLA